jgi:hypothetical protein
MKASDRPTKKLAAAGSWQTPDAPQFAGGLARSSSMGNLVSLFGGAARDSSFFPSVSKCVFCVWPVCFIKQNTSLV